MATNPPKKPRIPAVSELLDTDVLFPSMTAPDRLAVLMSSEHLLQVLDSLWFDSLKHRKVAEPNNAGTFSWKPAEEQTVRASGARANPALMIRLCYILGLVDEKTYEGLERVRFIRNRMAHSRLPMTLDESVFIKVLEELWTSLGYPALGSGKSILQSKDGSPLPPGWGVGDSPLEIGSRKLSFILSCLILSARLRDCFSKVSSPGPGAPGSAKT